MEARAYLKGLRITPRKVKIVLDLIRNKPVGTAAAILTHTPKAASVPCLKLLRSAAANAENNHGMDPSKLYVKECYVGPGPMKRMLLPRGRGSADTILKRTSQVTIVLGEKE